jgi:hypothetical protein
MNATRAVEWGYRIWQLTVVTRIILCPSIKRRTLLRARHCFLHKESSRLTKTGGHKVLIWAFLRMGTDFTAFFILNGGRLLFSFRQQSSHAFVFIINESLGKLTLPTKRSHHVKETKSYCWSSTNHWYHMLLQFDGTAHKCIVVRWNRWYFWNVVQLWVVEMISTNGVSRFQGQARWKENVTQSQFLRWVIMTVTFSSWAIMEW